MPITIYDGTGNNAALYDEAQTLANSYFYSPFGSVISAGETVANPFQYGGAHGVITEPSGLLYMKARYYDPATRRFVSADPLGSTAATATSTAAPPTTPGFVRPVNTSRLPPSHGMQIPEGHPWLIDPISPNIHLDGAATVPVASHTPSQGVGP